jgi:phosphatidylinositol alpha 1,6-mannosyltransferase
MHNAPMVQPASVSPSQAAYSDGGEKIPIAIAHASGVPVVAPRAGGPIDLLRHGENGFLFAADDESELRAHVQQLVTDAPARRRMGEAGRRGVLGRSWETLCAELVGHYELVVRERTLARRTLASAATG